jgi:hypothetical protein
MLHFSLFSFQFGYFLSLRPALGAHRRKAQRQTEANQTTSRIRIGLQLTERRLVDWLPLTKPKSPPLVAYDFIQYIKSSSSFDKKNWEKSRVLHKTITSPRLDSSSGI